jgi:predicted transcriptional regulator
MVTLTKEEVLRFVRKSIKKDEELIKRIEDSIKRTDAIMYGKPVKQKLNSKIQTNLSDRISEIIKPVYKTVAKTIKSLYHHGDLPKNKTS